MTKKSNASPALAPQTNVPNVFEDVPMNSSDSWRYVANIAWLAIYACGHPRGGCSAHCDLFGKIYEIALDRLKAEGNI